MNEPEFMTVDEAALLLRVDRKTLYDAVRAGSIPGVLRVKRAIRINRAALLAALAREQPLGWRFGNESAE